MDTHPMTTAEARADWLENRKREIDEHIDALRRWRNILLNEAELTLDREKGERLEIAAEAASKEIDALLLEKDNLSLDVPLGWLEVNTLSEPEGTTPSPYISGGEVFDPNPVIGSDEIPFASARK